MYQLKDPVSVIPKIGPKYKFFLENLNIHTVEDLLYHFPFRYEDYSNVKKIDQLQPNEQATIQIEIISITNINTKNGKRLTRAVVDDGSGHLPVIWFNQHFLIKILKKNIKYNLSGSVGSFENKPCLINPEIEEVKETNLNTGRLVGIYPETQGVSSKWIRSKIASLILNNDVSSQENHKTNIVEFLPTNLLVKQELMEINQAIRQIHFPENKQLASISRRRFAFEELFLELLNVEKRKLEWKKNLIGFSFLNIQEKVEAFIKNLPFQLTESQKNAVDQIIQDTQKTSPMNRLLEGDVGTGKTVVAVIAAYYAYLNNKKTLYLAPTEILAKQHFETFTKFLKNLEIMVELSTGSSKPKNNNWDILIGTHAILYSQEKYTEIGLIIVDEQHRFGVEQRGKIIHLGTQNYTPHLLSMTATPIPRTLALTIYGDLEISALKTHPNKDRKITTKAIPLSARGVTYEWIKNKDEPTFIVCPFIEESDATGLENVKAAQTEFKELSAGIFKNKKTGLLTGKMKQTEKDEIINKFRNGEIQILISTPVIEVGIDIPDATIMVIESAERYGLASLHQLRGRVGRGKKEGYCFAVMSSNAKQSFARLKNLETIDNGLELAELDLKMRGQGDLFGTMQHGEKKFRIASFSDLELVDQCKKAAEMTAPNINELPLLKEKVKAWGGELVKNN